MALLSVSDVEALSGGTFTDDEYYAASILIDFVQGEIEAFLGRSIEQRLHEDEQHIVSDGWGRIFLQNTPVVSIESVIWQGYTVPVNDYVFSHWGLTIPTGVPTAVTVPLASYDVMQVPYSISYIGGLDGTKIPALKSVLYRGVLREMTIFKEGWKGRAGYTAMTVEDYVWRKANAVVAAAAGQGSGQPETIGVGSIPPADVKVLARFKKRTVMSG